MFNKNNNKEHLNTKRLEVLFKQNKYSLPGNGCAGLLIVIFFWSKSGHFILASWLAASVLVLITRALLGYAYNSGKLINKSYEWCFNSFNIGAIISGSLWGILGVYLCTTESFSYPSVILLTIGGLVATSVVLYFASFLTYICFAYPAFLPIVLYFSFQQDLEMKFLGIMSSFFLIVLTIMSYKLNKIINRNVSYECENRNLLKKMEHERELVVQLNSDLMNELLKQRTLKEELKLENERAEVLTHRLKRLSTIDSLTGIANRRKFDEFLEKAWERTSRSKTPLSMVLCDIDFFKNYNDYYGHQSGDECLAKVATLLAEYARRNGDLAARYGGEEFSIILPDTDIENAAIIAEQMREAIEKLGIQHNASQVNDNITACFGVASIVPHNEIESSILISRADHALYQAKQSGKNSVVIFDALNQPANRCFPQINLTTDSAIPERSRERR